MGQLTFKLNEETKLNFPTLPTLDTDFCVFVKVFYSNNLSTFHILNSLNVPKRFNAYTQFDNVSLFGQLVGVTIQCQTMENSRYLTITNGQGDIILEELLCNLNDVSKEFFLNVDDDFSLEINI